MRSPTVEIHELWYLARRKNIIPTKLLISPTKEQILIGECLDTIHERANLEHDENYKVIKYRGLEIFVVINKGHEFLEVV